MVLYLRLSIGRIHQELPFVTNGWIDTILGAGSFAFYPPLQICGSSTKKIFFFFLSFFFYREIITFIFYRARERKEGEGCGRGSKYFLSKKFIPRTFLANIIYNGWLVYSTIWMIINNKKKCILSCVLLCIIHAFETLLTCKFEFFSGIFSDTGVSQ